MGVAPRLVPMAGKAGKYMVMENGPIAVRAAISKAKPLGGLIEDVCCREEVFAISQSEARKSFFLNS